MVAIFKLLVSRHYFRNRCEYVRSHSRSRVSTLLSRSRTAYAISSPFSTPSIHCHDVAGNVTDGPSSVGQQFIQDQSNNADQGEKVDFNITGSHY